jgi:cullin-associated NEDD8-dissociated protein 1
MWCCSLAPLVKKVSEARVVEMTNKLCEKLLHGKDQHRDIASIALKTIASEVTAISLAQSILVTLSPQLIKGITSPVSSKYNVSRSCHLEVSSPLLHNFLLHSFLPQGMSTEIKCECLDILCDVLHKFGNLMANDHELLLNALLSQLNSNQATVRKRTVSCIGKTELIFVIDFPCNTIILN